MTDKTDGWDEWEGIGVGFDVVGRLGVITLDRPKALNALTYDMAMAIEKAMREWADDDAVALVVIDAEGDKAFCAGGDIQDLYEHGKAGDYDFGRKFWSDEYRLNALIAEYEKPYVALMQGFVMGGGVGISCHGSHRIVCETTQIAMPECGIGLVPDVGGSFLLARAPWKFGEYLGLTGARMNTADAIHAGFADLFVPREDWPALIASLCEHGRTKAIGDFAKATEPSGLAELTAQDVRYVIGINVEATFLLLQETYRIMSAQRPVDGMRGQIQVITSVAAFTPFEQSALYCMSKYAQRGLVEVMRPYCARQRIRLLDVRPGATYTPMWGEVDDHQRAQMMVARDVANPMVDALLLPSRGSVEQLTIRPIEGDI